MNGITSALGAAVRSSDVRSETERSGAAPRAGTELHADPEVRPALTSEDLSKPDQNVELGVKPNRVDLITSISGVEFEDPWVHGVSGEIDGIEVNFIGREELIRNKESTGRPKDIGDADELRKRDSRR